MKRTQIIILLLMYSCFTFSSELKTFLHTSYKNDPQLKKILNDKNVLKYLVDQGLSGNEFVLSLNSETGYVSNQDENNSTLEASLTKKFITTGTNIALTHSKTIRPGQEGTTSGIRLEQSLLKDSFGSNVRLKRDSLQLQQLLGELEAAEKLEAYLLSLSSEYLNLKRLALEVQLAKSQLSQARELQRNIKRKFKSKIASIADLNRGELLVLSREENVLEKKQEFNQLKQSLVSVIGEEYSFRLNSDLDTILNKLTNIHISIKSNVDISQTRSFIMAKKREEIASKNLDLSVKEQGASLSFVAGFNRDDSSRFSTIIKQDETVVGFKLDIPIGDSQGRANESVAKIQKLSSHYERIRSKNDFDANLKQINSNLSNLKSKLALNKRKVKLTKELLKEETKRYSIGQIDLEQLISIKNDSFDLENSGLGIQIEYMNTLFSWLALTDNLLGIESKL